LTDDGLLVNFVSLYRYIDHCDSTFPSRFEEYDFTLKSKAMGIWGTKPPKVIADVVEALIGVAHSEGGYSLGQRCALYALTPITSAILRNRNMDETSHYALMQPQQLVMQQCPAAKIRAVEEDEYNGHDLWLGPSIGWGSRRDHNLDGAVGIITFYGVKLLAATDRGSRVVAKNRACSILSNILLRNPDLVAKLGKISFFLQKRDAMENNEQE